MIDAIKLKLLALLPTLGYTLFISSAVLVAMLLLEVLLIGWAESSARKLLRGGGSTWTDCISALLVLTNASLIIGTLLTFGSVYLLQRYVKDHFAVNLLTAVPVSALAFIIFTLALDCCNYWKHRLMHCYAPLWEIHKFHHSAVHMTMLTVLRDHPLDRVLVHGVSALPIALLGYPPEQYLLVGLAVQALGYLKHSNFHSSWGWFGTWVIQSPSAHRVHHSIAEEHHNTNFGVIFQFWDVLFGTAYDPAKTVSRQLEIGLTPAPASDGPLYQYLQPVRGLCGLLLRRFKAG
jgi:sterol desaturase/sphingolipid hydroxylase (fatty acid hydroxylase superfamily)